MSSSAGYRPLKPVAQSLKIQNSHHAYASGIHIVSSISLIVASELSKRPPLQLDGGNTIDLRLFAALAGIWSGLAHVAQYVFRQDDTTQLYSPYRWLDYSVSASLMVAPICCYAGQRDGDLIAAASLLMAIILASGALATELSASANSRSPLVFVASFFIYTTSWGVGFHKAEMAPVGLRLVVAWLLLVHLSCSFPLASVIFFKSRKISSVDYARASAAFSVASKITLHWTTYFVDPEGNGSVLFLAAAGMGVASGTLVFVMDS